MNKNLIKFGMFLLGLMLFTAVDSFAQYRRAPVRSSRNYGTVYSHRPPRVSVGVGIGNYWGRPYYPYYRPGISVGLGFPGIGATIYSLPGGYNRFYFGGMPYFYFNNTFFLKRDRGYVAVAPPLGATLERLPAGARLIKIDGINYYEVNGTYLLPDVDDKGRKSYLVVGTNGELSTDEAMRARDDAENYQEEDLPGRATDDSYQQENSDVVVRNGNKAADDDAVYSTGPQAGDQFDQLPRNSRSVVVKGKRLYQSPAGTYYKEIRINGETVYEVTTGE